MAEIYANADAFVHPNPREPFGIAPLEAMAAGLPVIAPNSGGLTAYANLANAWLTNPTPDRFRRRCLLHRRPPSKSANTRSATPAPPPNVSTGPPSHKHCLTLYQQLIAITKDTRIQPEIAPRVWSTPGDAWGRQIPPAGMLHNTK